MCNCADCRLQRVYERLGVPPADAAAYAHGWAPEACRPGWAPENADPPAPEAS